MTVEQQIAALRRQADLLESRNCTGLTARWCPTHGDCVCRVPESDMDDPNCPLHGPESSHATEPTLIGRARQRAVGDGETRSAALDQLTGLRNPRPETRTDHHEPGHTTATRTAPAAPSGEAANTAATPAP